MEISVTVKQLGRKHPLLNEEKMSISSEEVQLSVESLIRLIVLQQVESFNAKSFEQEDLDSIKIFVHHLVHWKQQCLWPYPVKVLPVEAVEAFHSSRQQFQGHC
ncbi:MULTISPECIES: hypothetical protein [Chryseobacterium]|uniref:Uncharacterized protein n=1 Tax=Chryseobacterium camelliae TaxID=1265445 RepID=A0ABU0TF24_9FLAO|nr:MULTISPECIES: hypothetical protein [Chryseobacterium]MDT3406533.1 hypothetical protein [Pseudacidovorax intermedius]MDQ1095668.1 hypothetical protein [Chryseobacterium camelliae]MDQ1099605.1 hypothetical protein [Chryseobacterium sp. SORGH_AS_1048]MDR6086953.1 hypothetical protein [Chryseobacterium sp. SORGH_AS_0909]MDR6131325.1 hypothetical protein [Chryseobacterium sp. SORGH_AS_1175]